MFLIGDEQFEEINVSGAVCRRNHNFMILHLWIDVHGAIGFRPVDKLLFLLVEKVVIYGVLREVYARVGLQELLLEQIHLLSSIKVNCAAE